MTLSKVYNTINTIMNLLETIDCMNTDRHQRTINQRKLNEAYSKLDCFRDELIREHIINKQKRSNK